MRGPGTGLAGWLGGAWSGLVDLVLPETCAGCGTAGGSRAAPNPRGTAGTFPAASDARGTAGASGVGPTVPGICPGCLAGLRALVPHPVRPTPPPEGLPPCFALGDYDGALRELLLGYKERGRRELARPLGDLLALVIVSALRYAGRPPGTPVLLVPVPDTPAAARDRYGDHMRVLARRAAPGVSALGWPAAVASPVSARRRADSAGLSSVSRAAAAAGAFAPRPRELDRLARASGLGAAVVGIDDILTTGATMSALAATLRSAGVPVPVAAVLAATRRRWRPASRGY